MPSISASIFEKDLVALRCVEGFTDTGLGLRIQPQTGTLREVDRTPKHLANLNETSRHETVANPEKAFWGNLKVHVQHFGLKL